MKRIQVYIDNSYNYKGSGQSYFDIGISLTFEPKLFAITIGLGFHHLEIEFHKK